jgi:hypothetical protein
MNNKAVRTVFCPVCSTGRELSRVSIPRLRLGLASILLALAAGAIGGFYLSIPSGLICAAAAGSLYYVFGEAVWQERGKKDLECPVCHFDPILYRRSPERAKQRCLDSLRMREDTFLAKWQALRQVTESKRGST